MIISWADCVEHLQVHGWSTAIVYYKFMNIGSILDLVWSIYLAFELSCSPWLFTPTGACGVTSREKATSMQAKWIRPIVHNLFPTEYCGMIYQRLQVLGCEWLSSIFSQNYKWNLYKRWWSCYNGRLYFSSPRIIRRINCANKSGIMKTKPYSVAE